MVRPLENQERLNPGEYVNRVRQTERGHGANARDFAYEIRELSEEEHRERQHSQEFGQDTYEHAPGQAPSADDTPPPADPPHAASTEDDNGNLDITV